MSDNWICWRLFLDELGYFLMVFWPWDSTIFCNSPGVSHSNSPSHCALGRYRHTSSSRQFCNIYVDCKFLIIAPDGGNGHFHCSRSFLKATSLICQAQLSFAAHQKYILCFFSFWWMIKGIWALFFLPRSKSRFFYSSHTQLYRI